MKKVLSLVLVLVLMLCSCMIVFAEEEESGSQFERILLKKGSAIIKYYEDAGAISTTEVFHNIYLAAATVTDLETNSNYCALRMTHYWYESQYSSGTSIGVIDSDEIDGTITTLEYIKSHQSEMKDYTEITYQTSSGLEIGAYKNSDESYLCVRFSSSDTAYIEIANIDTVIESLRAAQAKLQ